MADKAVNGGDTELYRNNSEGKQQQQRHDKETPPDKAGEYVRELLQEKLELDGQKTPNTVRLIDQGESRSPVPALFPRLPPTWGRT